MTETFPTRPIPWTQAELDQLIAKAFEEDLTGGDITSEAIFRPDQCVTARAIAKAPLVVCGLPVAARVFAWLDPATRWSVHAQEGQSVTPGTLLFTVEGAVRSVLSAERIALNLLQHLSGIATHARQFADAVAGTSTRVVDTRKTLPGLRVFQRYAVRVGGCYNHRYNLGSGVLIKENHIRAAGSITRAVQAARHYAPHLLKTEVEVTNLDELLEALAVQADVILLDNMSNDMMRQAVQLTDKRALLEASGNVTLERVRSIAQTGVDFVSVGALTHSVQAADISLLVHLNDSSPNSRPPDTLTASTQSTRTNPLATDNIASSSTNTLATDNIASSSTNTPSTDNIASSSTNTPSTEENASSQTQKNALSSASLPYADLDQALAKQEAPTGPYLPSVRPLLLEVASDLAKTLGLAASTQTPTNARFQKTLLPKLRESLFFSRGIRIPPIHLEESPQLRSGHFACWIEGTLVGSAEIPMDRLLVGVAPQELRIFQIEARKTHHPLSMRDASWVATEHKDRLKEAAVPIWQAEEVLTLHLTAILERHAERFLGIQALRAALDILAHHEPTLITQTLTRYPLDILRRVLLLLAEDRLSFCNLRRILESLLEVPQDTDEIEAIADTTRRIMRRYLCQAFSVQETQLLAYALEPELEALLRYLFLGDALPEDILPPTSIAPIQALYDALLRRFRALPSSASIPLLLVRDHALRRPLQRVLQRAFPYCGVLSWQEIDPDYDVMIVETLERDALDFQPNKDAT